MPASFVTSLRRALPAGQTLPREAWERRHRWMLAALWAQAAGLIAYSAATGYGLAHLIGHVIPVAAATLLAGTPRVSRRGRSVLASLGMLGAASIAVHLSLIHI